MFEILLGLAIFLCALVAGFLFAFASVVMPGIRRLNDFNFLSAFKAMDGVIQTQQPVFTIVWVGSVAAILATLVFSFWALAGVDRLLLWFAGASYLLGVQVPTAMVNIPLNNALQKLELESLSESRIQEVYLLFEQRWIKWNLIRTVLAAIATAMLIGVLGRA